VLGILTNEGGMTSHTAIMARALEIPAVIGLKDITERIKTQEYVAFDGETGQVSINPSKDEIEEFQRLRQSYRIQKELAKKERGKESKTLDGRKIKLCGNIASSEELSTLIHNDAEGIGLFRTEFLYMNRAMPPSEEEQYHIYCEVLETMAPRPVVIRTLDVGGDKSIPYLNTGKEENPFLGYRAIRLCLDQTQIFRIQLKALLRASVCGNLKIMFPMISTVEELLEVKAILAQVKEEMKSDGVAFFEGTEIGMMIEVPSAALMSDILAKHVDFFSIGTNDLIQYTMAVDRNNEKIQMLYQSYNPAVLRLIKAVIDNAHKEGIWVGMCGEMAADRKIIPVLLGMGLDEFSMSPSYILSARKLINSISFQEAQVIADEVLKLSSQDEINQYLIQNE
jgi:phosphotransferase system enzyme I (PtsI)